MKTLRHLTIATLACMTAGAANAALIGSVQTYPTVTLNQNYLIYDHNGIDADSGLFRVVSMGSTLSTVANSPANPGSTATQLYAGNGDSVADVMLSLQINNITGAFEGGSVTIGFGNNTATPGFSWTGTVSQFGYLDNGTAFDARWTLNSDQYQNMLANAYFADYVDGHFSGAAGGIKVSNSAGFGTYNWASALDKDWVFGTNVSRGTPANIASFVTGLDATGSRIQTNSTVMVDAFVPIPGALWLMMDGIGVIAQFTRRKPTAAT